MVDIMKIINRPTAITTCIYTNIHNIDIYTYTHIHFEISGPIGLFFSNKWAKRNKILQITLYRTSVGSVYIYIYIYTYKSGYTNTYTRSISTTQSNLYISISIYLSISTYL